MLDFVAPDWSFPNWPAFGLHEDTMKFVLEKRDRGEPVVLATLIDTTGGSPRPLGTQMAVSSDDITGFLSGGCIEADVALHARQTLIDGIPKRLVYGDQSKFLDIKLQCGASITIAVERLLPSDPAIEAYTRLRAARREIIWITDGEKRYVGSDISDFPAPQRDVAAIALSSRTGAGRHGDTCHWIRHRPPVRLIVVGSDPTTLAIARLATEAEFEVTLVRRSGPAEPPPARVDVYSRLSPEEVLAGLVLDNRTAIIFADHDFDASKHLVVSMLNSDAGYVGMIGAMRQRSSKVDFLKENGILDQDIERFKSPTGIQIGKSTPVAIAISIIAEVISVMQ